MKYLKQRDVKLDSIPGYGIGCEGHVFCLWQDGQGREQGGGQEGDGVPQEDRRWEGGGHRGGGAGSQAESHRPPGDPDEAVP